MADQQSAPPQYSPDGRWWWNGQEWVPTQAQAKGGPRVAVIVLGVVGALFLLLVLVALVLGTFLVPVGTQHDTSEVEGYCAVFPEDC